MSPSSPNRGTMRRIVGVMSGTSGDGVDAVLISTKGRGFGVKVNLERAFSLPWGEVGTHYRRISQGDLITIEEVAKLAYEVGNCYRSAVISLLNGTVPDLIVLHGQTVYHHPPYSLQLVNPWLVAQETRGVILYDLRGADLAAGGQGAPISPLADFVLFRRVDKMVCVVNLGGFINITLIPSRGRGERIEEWAQRVEGRDICVCNRLLDGLARLLIGKDYDENGEISHRGRGVLQWEEELLGSLRSQAGEHRSLGSGDDLLSLVEKYLHHHRPEDLLRSACRAISMVLSENIPPRAEVILAGGGTKNRTLVSELALRVGRFTTTDAFGIPSQYREAIAMAILGTLLWDGCPIILPHITGSDHPNWGGSWIFPDPHRAHNFFHYRGRRGGE